MRVEARLPSLSHIFRREHEPLDAADTSGERLADGMCGEEPPVHWNLVAVVVHRRRRYEGGHREDVSHEDLLAHILGLLAAEAE